MADTGYCSAHRHFGKEVIQSVLNLEANDPKIDALWLKIYKVNFDVKDSRLKTWTSKRC